MPRVALVHHHQARTVSRQEAQQRVPPLVQNVDRIWIVLRLREYALPLVHVDAEQLAVAGQQPGMAVHSLPSALLVHTRLQVEGRGGMRSHTNAVLKNNGTPSTSHACSRKLCAPAAGAWPAAMVCRGLIDDE